MAAKQLKIDSLELDPQNPRIPPATDQRDAMQKIISEQGVKLINLAESIAVRGFSPMDRCLVIGSTVRSGKYVVLEGNRRVLCAKLLKKPTLIDTFEMPESFKKRLHKAAEGFTPKLVEPVDCFEVATRAESDEWLNRRHQGQDNGRGLVEWSAIAKARFSGSNPALQAYDFVMEHGGLSDDEKELIVQKFPLTTLDRLLSTPSVRKAIGFEINKKKLETQLPPEEALKPLKRLILDLSDPKIINVTGLKKVEQQDAYIAKMKAADKPDFSKTTGKTVQVASITNSDFKVKPAAGAKKTRAARSTPRTHVVPKACKLNVSNAKIQEIYEELRSLLLSKHRHAIAVLLRVFLETSVDHYLKSASISLTVTTPNGPKDKSLRKKVEETIADMESKGAPKKEFIGVTKGLSDVNHPFSPDILHAYIHSGFYTPMERDLTAAWDNGQPLFERIWP
jgi:hypothetical protein